VRDALGTAGWRNGAAYNLGDPRSDLTLKELAAIAADDAGKRVVFDLPSDVEQRGYCPVQKTLLDSRKLQSLGWRANYDIAAGLSETIDILRELDQ